ncbi:MAG TPA: HepT-like ribonuclease domain-containing protein [Hyphomicrobiaceae bacterium]|jgi:uncharacterized protein with HEPN domain
MEAIELLSAEMSGVSLEAFQADKRKRWLVERGIEIISEASRHLSPELKGRHPQIPWRNVASIGNILRHHYERIAHDILWNVVRLDLPALESVCRQELAAEQTPDDGT